MKHGAESNGVGSSAIQNYSADENALLNAAEAGDHTAVEALLTAGADKEALDFSKRTPLHLAVVNGHLEVANALLAAGANKEALNNCNQTPLHLVAAVNGHLEMVNALLAAGANKEARDNCNKTPLLRAVQNGHLEMVNALLTAGADKEACSYDNQTPLHWAVSKRKVTRSYGNWAPWTARNGDLEMVNALLTARADKEARNNSNQTPLHRAAVHGHLEVVNALLEAGADKEARDNNNQTPLHLAADMGHLEVVQALVGAGADINAVYRGVDTAFVIAFERGHYGIVNFLRARGAQVPERFREEFEDADVPNVNGNQSVHTVSVHKGVSEAASALKNHYLPEDNERAAQVDAAIVALESFINALPFNQEVDGLTHPYGAAQRCLAWLKQIQYPFTDTRSGVTLKESLALLWLGLNDANELYRKHDEQGVYKQVVTDKAEFARKLKEKDNQELIQILTTGLYEIVRGYNLSKRAVDNGLPDNHTCMGGTFNKIMYTLSGRHSCVNIPVVTKETIIAKADSLINDVFAQLPTQQKENFARLSDEDAMPEALVQHLKTNLDAALHAEFDDFQDAGLDVKTIITEYVDNLEYKKPPQALLTLKRQLNEPAPEQPAFPEEEVVPSILHRARRKRVSEADALNNEAKNFIGNLPAKRRRPH